MAGLTSAGNRSITGLCNGCAISLAMAGADIQTVMDHVGWTTSSMARHYIKLSLVFSSSVDGGLVIYDAGEHNRQLS